MKPYQALIWSEWRQMRNNVIMLSGATILLWMLLLFGCFNKNLAGYIETTATALAIGLPLLYSIVLADSFGREFSQKTDNFLLELPASPTKIFFCKYFASLTVFLFLVALETQLMLYLINLTPGKHVIDGLQFRDWIITLITIATISILAHAMVFLTSLLGRKTGNGIVAIIIMPLLCLMLLPGAMTVTMWFANSDDTWLISSIVLMLIILFCFCIGFGWYLWNFRIARGRKIIRPVIVALCIILATPWLLYGLAYLYFQHSFNSAIREANAAGIETDIKKLIPPPVPDEQNAAPGILKFHHEYKTAHKLYFSKNSVSDRKEPILLPSRADSSWTGTYFNYNKNSRDTVSQKSILEATNLILNAPLMKQCYAILSEALKKPYCRFSKNFTTQKTYNLYFMAYQAGNFLTDRAYALRVSGRDNDFFACLADIDKLSDAFIEQPFQELKSRGLRLKAVEYRTAIAAGPDTVGAIKFYEQMIRDINAINPAMPDEIFRIYTYMEAIDQDKFFIHHDTTLSDRLSMECVKFFIPRKYQSAAAWVRWKIQQNKVQKQALASSSKIAINSALDSLEKVKNRIPGIFKSTNANIGLYFHFRAQFESCKLCLALKIYHIKYGKFPDSLQQLVPEILPDIPVDP
ncbi:MAG: hypothetical protein WC071_13085, partial [Victivallaceae bacterium]